MGTPGRWIVKTDDLAKILEEWIEEHEADHPPRTPSGKGSYSKMVDSFGFSGRSYICFHSGVSDRSLRKILHRRTVYTNLDKADKILVAIESTALSDGRLRVGKIPLMGNVGTPGGSKATEGGSRNEGGHEADEGGRETPEGSFARSGG